VLIVGWNRLGRHLVEQLDNAAAPGSTVNIVYDPQLLDAELDTSFCKRITVTQTPNDSLTLQQDHQLDQSPTPTTILLLAYRNSLSMSDADSRTLLNLMVVHRKLADRVTSPNVLVELLDAGNVSLAATNSADDFVFSDAIASSMIAQLAELPERRGVLLQLYDGVGPAVGMIDFSRLGLETETTFRQITRLAYARGLIAMGWSQSAGQGDKLTLNPHANDRIDLKPGDKIVVIG
jgi:hypothetical protein